MTLESSATPPTSAPHTLPAAVLWDMDGTLVDTEPYWIAAEKELAGAHGAVWTQSDVLSVVGSGLWTTAARLRERGVDLHPDDIVATLTDRVVARLGEAGTPWRPGAVDLLRQVREAGIPTALVTMSVGPMARAVVGQLPFSGFDLLITGDVVSKPKPDPAAYLSALQHLGVDARRAVAIEDSVPGVAAAVASGAATIAVPHVAEVADSGDHTTWSTLEHHTLDDLARVLAERNAR